MLKADGAGELGKLSVPDSKRKHPFAHEGFACNSIPRVE